MTPTEHECRRAILAAYVRWRAWHGPAGPAWRWAEALVMAADLGILLRGSHAEV